ncbi:carbohydrate ABC transporter permease [Enterococcus sp. JM9B]|uniref:carbohydrate ABC transporter permease n=1 Tax=Enterococcus sp. JM9B TaxID=1857216 RepID=UPI001374C9E8|nr:sugar ABC transporter permease [Enterococcus sp. JM9B]KAF1300883.1 ABC transporter permease [Enterococcus sp. JM9B]
MAQREQYVSKKKNLQKWIPYFYILPAAILVTVFFIASAVFTLGLSFTEWNGLSEIKFVGLANYFQLFKDGYFVQSMINTLIWVFAALIIPVLIPLFLAIIISKSRWGTIFKNLFYLPNAVSPTIGALIMTSLLSNYGLPKLLELAGMAQNNSYWLGIPYVNTFVMIGASVWQGIGTNLILLIVGLNNIPAEPIEAAQIDGASGLKLYRNVVLPLLKPTLIIVILMALINSFKTFDSIWLMTGGGPYRTSETLAVTMYKETFINGAYGYGSAVATVLSLIVLFISIFYLRRTFKEEQ